MIKTERQPLSKRQQEIMDFIISELKNSGQSPSIQEIAAFIGAKSTSTVHYQLSELEKKGYIVKNQGTSRSIKPVDWQYQNPYNDSGDALVEVPVIGEIAAGKPIFAYEDYQETVKIARSLITNGEAFILRVKGQSMVEDLIDDGDMVVVRKQNFAQNGDIIVALVENEAATLKRFYKEHNRIRLQPANRNMEPIYVPDVTILGRVISVIRPMERKARMMEFN
ncbi:MAG: transcriptional repressor LexA [Candidatus Wallbacteria bacterium]